jgi:hypothetical protein
VWQDGVGISCKLDCDSIVDDTYIWYSCTRHSTLGVAVAKSNDKNFAIQLYPMKSPQKRMASNETICLADCGLCSRELQAGDLSVGGCHFVLVCSHRKQCKLQQKNIALWPQQQLSSLRNRPVLEGLRISDKISRSKQNEQTVLDEFCGGSRKKDAKASASLACELKYDGECTGHQSLAQGIEGAKPDDNIGCQSNMQDKWTLENTIENSQTRKLRTSMTKAPNIAS